MSHATDNNPHTGATRYDSNYAKIPAVAIGLRDADWLSEQVKKGGVSATIKTNGHFLPDTIGHNVIGELKGTEFPDQIITIGGIWIAGIIVKALTMTGLVVYKLLKYSGHLMQSGISQKGQFALFYLPMKKMD